MFNVEQIDGLPEQYYQRPRVTLTPVERNARAEDFFRNTGAEIRYRGDRAFYACEGDYIQMPVIEAFRDAESFYATLAHETTHYADIRFMPRRCGRRRWTLAAPAGLSA